MLRNSVLKLMISIGLLSLPLLAQEAKPQDASAPAMAPGGDFADVNPLAKKVPADVILVKGAVPSASDSSAPLPENGKISENHYINPYFDFSYTLPAGFTQKYVGPPPSESGYYVLTQLEPAKQFEAAAPGSILVSAQDLFFNLTPAEDALAMVKFRQEKLGPDFKIERQPSEVNISGHSFIRFDYMSPVAELHWYTLTTQIRCHAVQFQFTSRDPELLESMTAAMNKMKLFGDAGSAPVCLKNYAVGNNVLHKVDPVLSVRKFNPVPVRIVIDKYGKVKHVHVISAFPDQAKAVTDALLQWEFRPYRKNGELVEVETGIIFGGSPGPGKPKTTAASVSD